METKVKNKYLDKYLKNTYLTYYVTLININYLCQWFANLLCTYMEENGNVIKNFELFIFSVSVALLEILIIGIFIYSNEKKRYEDLVNRRNYRSQIVNNAKEYSALKQDNVLKYDIYGFEYITAVEKKVKKGNEIWVITGDLEEDVNNENLGEIIHENLERGVIYRYFISKVNKKISKKASVGRDALKDNNSKYWGNRLFITEIESELIAPDVDIIIYNATSFFSKREGYVCVEIGDDQNTYAYQKLSREIIVDLYNRLKPENLRKKNKSREQRNTKKISYIVQVIYWILTVVVFAVLKINRATSLKEIFGTVISALILWLFTVMAIEVIETVFDKSFEEIEIIDGERKLITEVMSEQPLTNELLKLISQEEKRVFAKMNLGTVDEIINVDAKCQQIWLLTDLSHDIASKSFIKWLESQLTQFIHMDCVILHTGETAVLGRVPMVESLEKRYTNRVKRKQIDNFQKHYIWSETYGVIFVQNEGAEKDELYISLGTAEKPLFKKVKVTESESANVLGILRELYDDKEAIV